MALTTVLSRWRLPIETDGRTRAAARPNEDSTQSRFSRSRRLGRRRRQCCRRCCQPHDSDDSRRRRACATLSRTQHSLLGHKRRAQCTALRAALVYEVGAERAGGSVRLCTMQRASERPSDTMRHIFKAPSERAACRRSANPSALANKTPAGRPIRPASTF